MVSITDQPVERLVMSNVDDSAFNLGQKVISKILSAIACAKRVYN